MLGADRASRKQRHGDGVAVNKARFADGSDLAVAEKPCAGNFSNGSREGAGVVMRGAEKILASSVARKDQRGKRLRPAGIFPAEEFAEIRDVAVPKEELEGAKRTLVASFALGLENPAQVLQRLRRHLMPNGLASVLMAGAAAAPAPRVGGCTAPWPPPR